MARIPDDIEFRRRPGIVQGQGVVQRTNHVIPAVNDLGRNGFQGIDIAQDLVLFDKPLVDEVVGLDAADGQCVVRLGSFWKTNSFEQAVLTAANLGEDADTVAAICGQLAGAFYGERAIPSRWLEKLHERKEITTLADQLAMR